MTGQPDWPFVFPRRVNAIDGRRCRPPRWWRQGAGAWGCYQSHLRVIEQGINQRRRSILILEDDADWLKPSVERMTGFFGSLPTGWSEDSLIYLGGQHPSLDLHPPRRINDAVVRPSDVNRTHAYLVCGAVLGRLYRCRWPRAFEGFAFRLNQSGGDTVHFVPVPAGGRSGSALFDLSGPEPHIVGLIAWRSSAEGDHGLDGRGETHGYGIAMTHQEVWAGLSGRTSTSTVLLVPPPGAVQLPRRAVSQPRGAGV